MLTEGRTDGWMDWRWTNGHLDNFIISIRRNDPWNTHCVRWAFARGLDGIVNVISFLKRCRLFQRGLKYVQLHVARGSRRTAASKMARQEAAKILFSCTRRVTVLLWYRRALFLWWPWIMTIFCHGTSEHDCRYGVRVRYLLVIMVMVAIDESRQIYNICPFKSESLVMAPLK